MEQHKLSASLHRIKRVLNEGLLNSMGKGLGFCERLRVVTPYRMVMALLAVFSCMRVETLADIHRALTALFGGGLAYKPFHNQLAKATFPLLVRAVACELLTKLAVKVLRFKRGGPFSEFLGIVIQDGSSFAVNDRLRKLFPGRFKAVSPAAVELHATLDILEGEVQRVALTADTAGEREQLPEPKSLWRKLLLADRGYFCVAYFWELIEAGASFLFRGKKSMNPLVLDAVTASGKRLKRLAGKELKTRKRLPRREPVDLDVEWQTAHGPLRCRLVVSWNPATKEYGYFATNLPRDRYPVALVLRAYRLRWQIELLFKEWKSYANLHAFNTSKESITEGLVWAALAAAALKRYLAYAAQAVGGVEISTRKVAMCCAHVLLEVFYALAARTSRRLLRAWRRAILYLSAHATRAHPKRDRISGRLACGLQPVFAMA